MTWAKQLDLYIDLDSLGTSDSPLLRVQGTSVSRTAVPPVVVAGDTLLLKLHLVRYNSTTGEWVPQELDDSAMLMLGKLLPADATPLFQVSSFTFAADSTYQGILNLTSALITGATFTGGLFTAHVDLEIQNSDNSLRATFQFSISIRQQYVIGTESDPTIAIPSYPAPDALILKRTGSTTPTAVSTLVDLSGFALEAPPYVFCQAISKAIVFASVSDVSDTGFTINLSSFAAADETVVKWLIVTP